MPSILEENLELQAFSDAIFAEEDTVPLEPLVSENKPLHPSDSNQQAVSGALLTQENPIEVFHQIKDEFDFLSESPLLEEIKSFLDKDDEDTRRSEVDKILADPTIPSEKKTQAVVGYSALREQEFNINEKSFINTSIADNANTEEEASIKDRQLERLDAILSYQKDVKTIHNASVASLDSNTAKAFGDFMAFMVPFMETIDLQQIVADIGDDIGVEASMGDVFLFGNLKTEIKDAIFNMNPEDRIGAIEKLVIAIESHAGIVLDNDFAKHYLLTDFLEQGAYGGGREFLDNVVGILDPLIPVGVVAKNARQATRAKRLLGGIDPASPLARIVAANPRLGQELAAATIADKTGKTAKILGIDEVELVTNFNFPKPDVNLNGAPAKVIEKVQELESMGEQLAKMVETSGILFTEAEKKAARFDVLRNLRGLQGMKLHLPKSGFLNKESEGFAFKAIFGANDITGFRTPEEALTAARRAFGDIDTPDNKFFEGIRILSRDPIDGSTDEVFESIFEVEKATGRQGDYFVEFTHKQAYDPLIAAALGQDAITHQWAGRSAKYALPVASRFSNIIRAGFNRANDVGALMEKSFIHAGLTPLLKLGSKSQAKVMKAVETGARNQKNYRTHTLRTNFGLNEKEVLAYHTFRRTNDMLWSINNRDTFRDLFRDGFKSLYSGDTDTGIIAKSMNEETAIRNVSDVDFRVYDPILEESKKLDSSDIRKLYGRGGSLANTKHTERHGRHQYNVILIEPQTGSKLAKLTDTPLQYTEGYYQRFYKDPYYVDYKTLNGTLNGKPQTTTRTVATARTRQEAEMIKSRLLANIPEEDLKNVEIIPRRGREVSVYMNLRDLDVQQMKSFGISSRRERGAHLEAMDEVSEIEDPIHSFISSVYAVSNHVSQKQVVDTMTARFSKTWPKLVQDGWPTSVKSLEKLGRAGGLNQKDINQAIQLYEYIQNFRGMPSQLTKVYRESILKVADVISSIPVFSKQAQTVASTFTKTGLLISNPATAVKSAAFISYIALNPVRQFFVQGSQLLQMTAIDPSYLISGGMTRDMSAISLMIAMKNKDQALALRAASLISGKSEAEMRMMTDAFESTGLRLSIDTNAFVEGAASLSNRLIIKGGYEQSLVKQVAGFGGKVVGQAIRIPRVAGFDAGEFNNLLGTWLVAQRRWIKNNPDKISPYTRQAIDEIASDARELSYAMSRSGKMGYQGYSTSWISDILSIPGQFMSVPHKAMTTMLPEAIKIGKIKIPTGGSRVLTDGEKARLAGLNFIFFGAAGLPFMNDLMDEFLEVADIQLDEKEWIGMKGGFIDLALLYAMNDSFQDPETKLAVSKSIAPGSIKWGPIEDMFATFLNNPSVTSLNSAAASVSSRVVKAVYDINTISQMPDISTPEKLKESMIALGNISSGFSNYYKMKFMLETGKSVSGNGNIGVEVTRSEAIAKMFGITSYNEDQYYELVNKIFGKPSISGIGGTIEKDLRKDAKSLYNSLKRIYTIYEGNNKDIDSQLRMYRYVWSVYNDEAERNIIINEFGRLIERDQDRGLPTLITHILKHNFGGEMSEELADSIRNLQSVDEGTREILLEQLGSFKDRK